MKSLLSTTTMLISHTDLSYDSLCASEIYRELLIVFWNKSTQFLSAYHLFTFQLIPSAYPFLLWTWTFLAPQTSVQLYNLVLNPDFIKDWDSASSLSSEAYTINMTLSRHANVHIWVFGIAGSGQWRNARIQTPKQIKKKQYGEFYNLNISNGFVNETI